MKETSYFPVVISDQS